jgi:UDP:flavonoid glycosyltransferase YjiC (YdhE family)
MNIAIIALGTRGDVQPYIALGLGFKRMGHQVRIVTHTNFSSFVDAYGLDFAPVKMSIEDLLGGEAGQAILVSGNNKVAFFRHFTQIARPVMKKVLSDTWHACRESDVILHSFFGLFASKSIAERLNVPFYPALIWPDTPTYAFAHHLCPPEFRLGRVYNRLTYTVIEQVFWRLFRHLFNAVREEVLELPPVKKIPFPQIRKDRIPVLYGYSSSVLPRPQDWPDWVHVTGYWFLENYSHWLPPDDLVDFLKSGSKPVYIGFGSMSNHDPVHMTNTAIQALKLSKRRGVIVGGQYGRAEGNLPEEVYQIDEIPHDWLFPQMDAVVHHGGAGTVAAGLRAGCPTIVIPFFSDQPFWGWCVYKAGAGPKPISRKKLTPELLADVITTVVNNKSMKQSAEAIGERIREENGVERAVELIHYYTNKAGKP